jgi:hypothetical protein
MLLGRYRSHHGGTQLLEMLSMLGIMASIALPRRMAHEFHDWAPIRRAVFGALAGCFIIMIFVTITRHGLHF